MKKHTFILALTIVLSVVLSACSSSNNEAVVETNLTPKEMVDEMLAKVEQPSLMEVEEDMVAQLYHLAPSLLEDYSIRMPMMNVKSNEIAILKVKDAKDISTVETAVKERATDIQKQFEQYLPDQYENAQNYKLVTKGNYILFVISESADQLVTEFDTLFTKKIISNGIQQPTVPIPVPAGCPCTLLCFAMANQKPHFVLKQSGVLCLGRTRLHCYYVAVHHYGFRLWSTS